MIEARGLTKRFGDVTAVDDLTFTVDPGHVTGFLGPNGAGKSSTMRMVLGLDRPTSGTARVNGHRYVDLPAPLREVGALLDARAVHQNRRARDHLLCVAQSNGIGRRRVDEVLDMVGLEAAARKRVATFSLGMSQRLGIAAALLGDPPVLLFDEPVNGLDPEGMLWIRHLLRGLAAEGRTVLVSSHLLAEMAEIADRLIVVGRGRLLADVPTDEILDRHGARAVLVRIASPTCPAFTDQLARESAQVAEHPDGALLVSGMEAARIASVAAATGAVLTELTPQSTSLEAVFMAMTQDHTEYRTGEGATR
ncbi:ABC transporter ATP-binding protein [Nocardiopsis synnemataformans]|uniref:ABC transporter ATP-binding protein n=1 Tax=Nocardiopsis synnemataformans TaxID=61305 RepID=UPI003EBAA978